MQEPGASRSASIASDPGSGQLRRVLDRRAEWIEALVVLTTLAAGFVVLGFLASYFDNYSRIILIFFFAWLLAFLISPVADWLQRRLMHLPRPVAVIAVIVPVIVIGAIVLVKVVASLAESFVELAGALPDLATHPPSFLTDLQRWLDSVGIHVERRSDPSRRSCPMWSRTPST